MSVALLGLIVGACGGSSAVEASDAWSRPVPPVARAGAVFVEIDNGLDTDVTLQSASSDACGAMEIHRTQMIDGVMSMRPLEGGLVIGGGETASLEPGGIHLMCIDPDHDGSSFSVTLEFVGAPAIDLDVVVEDR
jgi:copper(I)-binding protein